MKTKTQEVIDAYDRGDRQKAIAIIHRFRRLPKKDLTLFGQVHGIYTNHRFYAQIKTADAMDKILVDGLKLLGQWVFDNRK